MNPIPKFYFFVLFQILLFGISCQREVVDLNKPPIANSGSDQTIYLPATSVLLDGSKSNDPENTIIRYEWRKIEGPSSFRIVNDHVVQTEVVELIKGIYKFELKVTDLGLLSSRDTIQINVFEVTNPTDPTGSVKCNNINRSTITAKLIQIGNENWPIYTASSGKKIIWTGYPDPSNYGEDATNIVTIYDTDTKVWSIAELSAPRWNTAVFASESKIFVAGGINSHGQTFDNIDIFDASSGSWTTAKLSEGRHAMIGASVGSKVFFAGGSTATNQSNKVDIYDLNTNTWSVNNLPGIRMYDFTIKVSDKIYFFGRQGIDLYDNSKGTWSTEDWSPGGYITAGIEAEGKIYLTNGYNLNPSKTMFIFDIRSHTLSQACLNEENCNSYIVKKGNQILIFPGLCPFPSPFWGRSNFDIYNFQQGTWSIGQLDRPIVITSVINVNDEIYIAGGSHNLNGTSSGGIWKLEF